MNAASTPVGALQTLAEATSEHREAFDSVLDRVSLDLDHLTLQLEQACQAAPSPGAEAARHLTLAGGKRVRPVATILAALCATPNLHSEARKQVQRVALATELIHSATLLHDDVIDDGAERRGRPCARILWGNAVSVLAGDHLLVSALQSVFKMSMPHIMNDMLATLSRMVDAEILQLRGRKQLDLRESTYREIIAGKTASLFGFACKSGALAAGASAPIAATLEIAGSRLGVAFQLIDDVLDFSADRDVLGKDLAADVREGKPTLPLIFAAERDPSLLAMLHLLREGQASLAADIASRVVTSGACQTVMEHAQNEAKEAISALSALPASPARTALEAVVRQSVDRVR